MDESKKTENLNKKHFAKLHERIQNKYEAMQKKIHHSKSMDSLCLPDDDESSVNSENGDAYSEKTDKKVVKYSIVEENVNKQDATLKDYWEDPIYESEVTPALNELEYNENLFFGEDFTNFYLDSPDPNTNPAQSLKNEDRIVDENTNETTPLSPETSQKHSLRHKIGVKLNAAIEKRREKKNREGKEAVEKLLLSNKPVRQDSHVKKKNKIGIASVAIIHADWPENVTNEKPETNTGEKMFCRLRLGQEKRKTKSIKSTDSKILWQELFNFSIFDEYILEVTVCSRDNSVGSYSIDLSNLDKDKTHKINVNLEKCSSPMKLQMLITISATLHDNLLEEQENGDHGELQKYDEKMKRTWSLCALRNSDDIPKVGWLNVNLFGAEGLSATDTYCVVELINDRVQTQTKYKTNDPNWMKNLRFDVHDITSILYFTVYEEKKSGDVVIGKLAIPLLNIQNREKKWYALKDPNFTGRAKGKNPRVEMQMYLFYNPIKAAFRVITPKEAVLLSTPREFDRRLFSNNILRAKTVVTWIVSAFKVVKTLFEYEDPRLNFIALLAWVSFWWLYKHWMVPLLLMVPFIWYLPPKYQIVRFRQESPPPPEQEEQKEQSRTLRQKFQSLTDLVTGVQNDIGFFASLGESVKNLVNFTVPFLSTIAIILILMLTFVVFLIPPRYLFMGWGIYKYIRKIIWPRRIPNNEILDLISRVPDDELLMSTKELPLVDETESRDDKRASFVSSDSKNIFSEDKRPSTTE